MSTAIPEGEAYYMGLEGLRTYERHDVDRDGPFYPCNVAAEPLTLYGSGGYHPVHLGDILQEGRYIVVHKLGWELDGTIWLARDRKLSRDVAIKFLVSDRDKEGGEESTLRRLADGPAEYPGKGHIVRLFDQFEVSGPNGHHQCLVTEALGPRLRPGLLSPREFWEVAKQLVEATIYMHSINIVHGNICDDNVLLTGSELLRADECPPIKNYRICEVETVDGSLTAQAPRYQVEYADPKYIAGNPCVKVIGFGKNCMRGIHYGVPIPFNYKAPEVIFGSQPSPSADIWSLGCMVFETTTERALYCDRAEHKDELVEDWIYTFGDLPKEWRHHTPPRTEDSPSPGEFGVMSTLQETIDELRPGDLWFTKPDIDMFGDLIVSMTQYRPSDRPSASDVLQHPWFQRRPAMVYTPGEITLQNMYKDQEKFKEKFKKRYQKEPE